MKVVDFKVKSVQFLIYCNESLDIIRVIIANKYEKIYDL